MTREEAERIARLVETRDPYVTTLRVYDALRAALDGWAAAEREHQSDFASWQEAARDVAGRLTRERDEARSQLALAMAWSREMAEGFWGRAAAHFCHERDEAREALAAARDAALEEAATRLESRATSEQITAEQRAQDDGEHSPVVIRRIAVAMVLRDEAQRIRALKGRRDD